MAVVQPRVEWWDKNNLNPISRWDIGVVDAGTVSDNFTFLIWNNRAKDSDVPDMLDCRITTKDEMGGETGELITGQWIEVKVDSLSETTFKPIGYDAENNVVVSRAIKTRASTTYNSVISTPEVPPHTSVGGEVCILGVANDGTIANSAGNFVQVTLHANIPSTAVAGLINFKTRITYKYV